MRSYIDETDKVNEIRLLINHPLYKDKIILLVEGKSDIRLFRNIIQHKNISIESIDGKKDLLKAMKTLVPEIPDKILSICDADHDHLRGKKEKREKYHIYLTDYHDAEMLLLSSPSLKSFIDEYAANADCSIQLKQHLLTNALNAAYIMGLVRWINTDKSLNINFKGLNYSEFIDVHNLTIKFNKKYYIESLLTRSKKLKSNLDYDKLDSYIDSYNVKEACKFQVCSGHDVTNIIAIVFRQKRISMLTNINHTKIESSLRIGYQRDAFYVTMLFKKLKKHFATLDINIVPDT